MRTHIGGFNELREYFVSTRVKLISRGELLDINDFEL